MRIKPYKKHACNAALRDYIRRTATVDMMYKDDEACRLIVKHHIQPAIELDDLTAAYV